ncbi:hypothetical protein PVAND_001093 [Polypedilum vanderplanki]|nr:hypothetical protein PVAND_001093 [Polypedilum vanderplanki]
MFEFMTSDMRKPLPASLEDLIEMNYTIVITSVYSIKYNEELINGRNKPKIITLKLKEFSNSYKRALAGETKEKFAFFVSSNVHDSWNSSFMNSLLIMENEKITISMGITMPKNNILLFYINDIISRLIPSGILQYQVNYGSWSLNRPVEAEPEDTKKILSISDLEFGFVIFLGFLSLATVVFVCELHALYVRRQLSKLLGLYEFIRVIRERLKDYHDKW